MLYHIATTDDDELFKECDRLIAASYFDEEEYQTPARRRMLPSWRYDELPSEEKQLEEIARSLASITIDVCRGGKYVLATGQETRLPFPFIERFHAYFLQRKWNKPTRDPQKPEKAKELVRLNNFGNIEEAAQSDSAGRSEDQNYSKNAGDHNHFRNVVAAMARLIKRFHDEKKIMEFLPPGCSSSKTWAQFARTVKFDSKAHGSRIFILMLAAYFHDIGKTIVYHRHGMEGSVIISEHTSQSWYQLNRIAKQYGFREEFSRNDLLYISDLLDFHDRFGTMSTGEAGYLQLVEMIERIKRYSLKHKEREDQIAWNFRYLFDLWLLNVADIFVSLTRKWEHQEEWLTREDAETKIQRIIHKERSKICLLTHDLHMAIELLNTVNQHRHTDIYPDLIAKAQLYSDRHVIERIRRMIFACLGLSVRKFIPQKDQDRHGRKNRAISLKNNPDFRKFVFHLYKEKDLNESTLDSAIERSISAMGDLQEFCYKFSWIGQMDYALGFFESICSRALQMVYHELLPSTLPAQPYPPSNNSCEESLRKNHLAYCFRTKWIREKFVEPLDMATSPDLHAQEENLAKLQGWQFLENFTITLVSILDHLLFRDSGASNRIKNIEFNETKQRLTAEKIDAIIALNGPYHARRSIQMILKTVFIY